MKKKNFLPFVWIFLFVTTSCISDFDLLNTSAEILIDETLVLPIGESSMSVDELLAKFGLPENFDTVNTEINYSRLFHYEYYNDRLAQVDTLKAFYKTIYLSPIPSVIPANISVDLPLYDATVELPINYTEFTEERVDSAIVNSAKLRVQVDVSPDLVGVPVSALKIEFIFPEDMLHIYSGVKPIFEPVAYGQPGFINLGKIGVKLNGAKKIPFKIKVDVAPLSAPVSISSTSKVELKMKFEDVDIHIVYGLFNMNIESIGNFDLPINLNDYLPNSLLKFANPKLDVTVSSNIGMDLNFKVNSLKLYNKANPTNVFDAMFYDAQTQTKNTYYSDNFIGPTTVGSSITKIFNQFNSVNSEIDKIFDSKPYPDALDFKVIMSTNTARTSHFFTADNIVTADVKAIVPLQFKGGSQHTITDTINNINIGDLLDNLDSALLVLKIKNGLPLKAKYRMTFWKSTMPNDTIPAIGGSISTVVDATTLGNLTSQYLLISPTVSVEGRVDKIVPQTIKISLTKDQIAVLKLTKFIIYSLVLENSETEINGVKISNPAILSTKNKFAVQLGVYLKANAVINPFNNANQ